MIGEDYVWTPIPWCFLRSLAVALVVGFLGGTWFGVWVSWRQGWK